MHSDALKARKSQLSKSQFVKINSIIEDSEQDHESNYDKITVLDDKEIQHAVFLINENMTEKVHKNNTHSAA